MIESDTKEKEATVYVRDLENEKRFVEEVLKLEDVVEILGCNVAVKDIYGIEN